MLAVRAFFLKGRKSFLESKPENAHINEVRHIFPSMPKEEPKNDSSEDICRVSSSCDESQARLHHDQKERELCKLEIVHGIKLLEEQQKQGHVHCEVEVVCHPVRHGEAVEAGETPQVVLRVSNSESS